MLHYYAKDFFAPLIITGRLNTDRSLDIYVVNEYLPIYGAIVFLRVFEWQSFQEVLNQNLTLNIVIFFYYLCFVFSLICFCYFLAVRHIDKDGPWHRTSGHIPEQL